MMNTTASNSTKAPLRQALEDALVVGGFSALGGLIAAGYPPCAEIVYGCGLASLLAGLTAYAKARAIKPL